MDHTGIPQWLSSKESPAMQEKQDQALGGEDPLEKEMAMHSRILPQDIPWTEDKGAWGLQSMGLQRVRHDFVTKQQWITLAILLKIVYRETRR